jgi:hypothetical protein
LEQSCSARRNAIRCLGCRRRCAISGLTILVVLPKGKCGDNCVSIDREREALCEALYEALPTIDPACGPPLDRSIKSSISKTIKIHRSSAACPGVQCHAVRCNVSGTSGCQAGREFVADSPAARMSGGQLHIGPLSGNALELTVTVHWVGGDCLTVHCNAME